MKRFMLLITLMTLAFGAKAYHWTPNSAPYSSTATMIGVVQIDGVEQSSTNLEVGAFCGDECRGREMLMDVSQLNQTILFLTVFGNNGDELSFRIYDHSLDQELDATCSSTVTFTTDAMFGTATSPYVLNFENAVVSYTISATVSPAAGGTVTGAGTYNSGTTATLTATAATGYTFLNWTEGGEVVSTEATYSFTVTGERNLVANFSINGYAISATVNPVTGGAVTGTGAFDYGTTATLTATAATGYSFVNWTDEGEVVSTDATYSFTVTEDRTLVANFSHITYAVNATVNPSAGGTVSGTGTYNHGSIATLTATAATGYIFLNWTEDGEVVSTNATYSFAVTGARALVANFSTEAFNVSVSIDPAEGGTVTGQGSYSYGSTATLTAQAAVGYDFVNWTENGEVVSTDATYSFMVTEDRSLTAHFTYVGITYHWSPNSSPYSSTATMIGIIQIDGEEQRLNTLEVGVFCGEECRGREMPMYVSQLDRYILFLTIFGNNGDELIFHLYDHSLHQELELTCESTETFATDAMYGIATSPYVLNFVSVINIYTVSVTANPAAGGAVTGAGSFNQGSTATVTATPADGYVFISWTYDGEVVSSDASYSFVVTEDRTLVANFDLNSYTVSVLANPETGGSITGAGAFAHGSTATLTATAATGYSFLNWTEEGEVVSTNATYSFTVTEDRTLVANFSLNSYVINASATPTEGGAVTGIGTFNYGTIVTLTATAATGYTFLNWTEEGEVVSTDATYSFTVTDNRTLMANFTTEAYNVTVSIDPAEGGSVTGDGAYAYGSTATLTAQAAAGYDFVNWTENGEVVSTDATLSFMVTEDKSFTAHFTYVGITYHWSPNSSPYSSTATMIGIIQIDGEEQRLNTLEVGVFCGDECRGREMSMYVPQLDRYILFLTIFGNNGDEVVFRLYDHSLHQESELTCESTETFATDAMYGTATSPYVLNFVSASETTQTITLGSGWTWFSSYIEYSDASLGQLQTGIAANSTTAMIKGQTEFTSFGSGNWSGGLTNLNNESMYLISSNGGEITLTGSLADPTAHPITLTNGWSWIGFLSDTPMSIDEAMSSITPSVNDMVKSQDGFTTFDGSKWTGGLTTLVPGQGYLYLHNGEPIILTYPSPSK